MSYISSIKLTICSAALLVASCGDRVATMAALELDVSHRGPAGADAMAPSAGDVVVPDAADVAMDGPRAGPDGPVGDGPAADGPADATLPSADAALPLADAALPLADAALLLTDAALLLTDAAAPDAALRPAAACFEDAFVNPNEIGPDYDQFQPVVGGHCRGTNHQDIRNVERVVFLGDSVTVGTPPTLVSDYYRSRLARTLAQRFGLMAPDPLWMNVDLFNGVALLRDAGDFSSCAKYGARTDDLLQDSTQLVDCLPPEKRHLRTLVILTIGGNDIANLTKDGLEGATLDVLWAQTREFVGLMRDAAHWIKDPANFPNGSYLVFANMFEFTDGTGDTAACPAAGLAGFGAAWEDPQALADMVIWANEQYLQIAVETGSDMTFMLESFCGHGFNAGNEAAPCFRGAGTPTWFDLTCIHPNPDGHREIADMFMAVVEE